MKTCINHTHTHAHNTHPITKAHTDIVAASHSKDSCQSTTECVDDFFFHVIIYV